MSNTPSPTARDLPVWLTETQAAERLNMSVKWLQKRRLTGEPPQFAKFGSSIRYSRDVLLAFENACVRSSTSDTGGRKAPGGR